MKGIQVNTESEIETPDVKDPTYKGNDKNKNTNPFVQKINHSVKII